MAQTCTNLTATQFALIRDKVLKLNPNLVSVNFAFERDKTVTMSVKLNFPADLLGPCSMSSSDQTLYAVLDTNSGNNYQSSTLPYLAFSLLNNYIALVSTNNDILMNTDGSKGEHGNTFTLADQ